MATAVALSPSQTATHQSSAMQSSSNGSGAHPLAASPPARPQLTSKHTGSSNGSSPTPTRAHAHAEQQDDEARLSPVIGGTTHRGWLALAGQSQSSERLAPASPRTDDDDDEGLQQKPKWAKSAASSAALGERKASGIGYPYPAMSTEAREAEAIEQNLERWAAEERQRRRALRASRSGSVLGSSGKGVSSSSSSLARRLSTLGRSGKTSSDKLNGNANSSATALSALSPPASASSNDLLRRSSHTDSLSSAGDSDDKNSFTGSSGRALDASLLDDVPEHEDSTESGVSSSEASRRAKGKGRALESSLDGSEDSRWDPPSAAEQRRLASDSYSAAARTADPFRDEAAAATTPERKRTSTYGASPSSNASTATVTRGGVGMSRSQSGKATPRHPIVTPGRAPTIRHRAEKAGTQAPQIVATDVDSASGGGKNPFISSAEADAAGGGAAAGGSKYAMRVGAAYGAARRREGTEPIEEEDEDMVSPQSGGPRIADPVALPRKSTSSSRFNEVGLDEDDAEAEAWQARSAAAQSQRSRGQSSAQDEEEGQRSPWWTDWLCGCSNHVDDDQQTGKTGPDLV